jgi:hypothetical protein
MLVTMGHWLSTIPLGEPWQAIVMVVEVLMFAAVLHSLWELGFMLANRLFRPVSRSRVSRMRNISTRSISGVAFDTVGVNRPNAKI